MQDMKQMGQQMINLYKTIFDNSFSTVMMLQEQMERLRTMYLGTDGHPPGRGQKGPG